MTRLNAIFALIERADIIADVGCDHGLVAEYCLSRKLGNRIIASDISDKCLQKAKDRLDDAQNVEFRVCDGIAYKCDEAIIAGMGGLLIKKILVCAAEAGLLPNTFVLMPHRDADAVRRTITELCYDIDADLMVKDGKRFYSAIRAKRCETVKPLTESQYLFGKYAEVKNNALTEYLTMLYNTYKAAPQKNADKLKYVTSALKVQGVTIT